MPPKSPATAAKKTASKPAAPAKKPATKAPAKAKKPTVPAISPDLQTAEEVWAEYESLSTDANIDHLINYHYDNLDTQTLMLEDIEANDQLEDFREHLNRLLKAAAEAKK